MRFVFLCTSSIEDASPQGRWLPIACELTNGGHEVHVLMLHPMFDQLAAKQVVLNAAGTLVAQHVGQMHVYGKPGSRRYFGPLQLLGITARATFALARHAIALKPDVIQVCKPQPMNGLAGLIAARWLNRPLHVDCDDYEAESNRFSSAWQKKLVQFFEDRLPCLARAITVNTRFLFNRYRSLGIPAEKMTYVPNGIAANPQPPIANRQFPISKIVYVGTMSKISHGTDLLIEAFALLRRQFADVRLVMVGDGDDRPALVAQAQTLGIGAAIDWVGRVPFAQTQAYYADAICSVDPVFDRPVMGARSPLKIVESLACGTPVVTGDVGDRRETLLGGQPCGVLVAPGNAQALADGFATLLGDANLRAEMAHNAPLRAREFDWAALAQRWAGQYPPNGRLWGQNKPHAAIVHLFYLDLAAELLGALLPLQAQLDIYVTVPEKAAAQFEASILALCPAARVLPVANRGRDILPFMMVLTQIQHLNYGFILKLHSKKSKHLADGARWRNEVVGGLTDDADKLLAYITEPTHRVALVAPRGHIVDGKKYVGGNLARMRALLALYGIALDDAHIPAFPAGSMYWIRKDVADLLLKLSPESFEPERGQIDVTLAHAIERIVLALAVKDGSRAIYPNLLDYQHEVNQNYEFAHDSANTPPVKRSRWQKIVRWLGGR